MHDEKSTYDLNFLEAADRAKEALGLKDEQVIIMKNIPETNACYEAEDRFIELTIEKLKEHDLLDPERVMFISFSLHMCEVLAEKLPEFTVQFLGSSRNPNKLARRGINGVDFHHDVFTIHKGWYKQARRNNMSVNAWTVNKEKDMQKMIQMGVDMLTTDNPLEARGLMEKSDVIELK